MAKPKPHNEWFRSVSLGNRKSCPVCRLKLAEGEKVWSWGEYIRVRWNTIRYFCKHCWPDIQKELYKHLDECGCSFNLIGKGGQLPAWLVLPERPCDIKKAA